MSPVIKGLKKFHPSALIHEEKVSRFLENFESDLLRGIAKLCLLRIIKQYGSEGTYGYQILKEIEQTTNNKLVIEEGTLYPMLKNLEKWGTGDDKLQLVHSTRKKVDGRTRKYYAITDDGLRIFNHLEGFFTSIINALSNLLDYQVILDEKSFLYCPNCSNKILLDENIVSNCEICGYPVHDREVNNDD